MKKSKLKEIEAEAAKRILEEKLAADEEKKRMDVLLSAFRL